MNYILQNSPMRIEWTIVRSNTDVKEDFSKAKVAMFLHHGFDRRMVPCVVENGVLIGTIDFALPIGIYDVSLVWLKNDWRDEANLPKPCHARHDHVLNRYGVNRSRKDQLFAITDVASEAENEGHGNVTIKLKSNFACYAYDGLDAYEVGVLKGLIEYGEDEWINYIKEVPQLNAEHKRISDQMVSISGTNDSLTREIARITTTLSKYNGALVVKGKAMYDDEYYGMNGGWSSDADGQQGLPSASGIEVSVGWAYQVGEAGTYAGQKCAVGDWLVCVQAYTGDGTRGNMNKNYWAVLQGNIDAAELLRRIEVAENAVNTEKQRALNAERTLAQADTAEQAERRAADSNLEALINRVGNRTTVVESNIAELRQTAKSLNDDASAYDNKHTNAEQSLRESLSIEKTERENADGILTAQYNSLDAKHTAAENNIRAAISTLGENLDTERTSREADISSLSTRLDEVAADTSKVDAERQRAEQAETTITQRVDNVENDLLSKVTIEDLAYSAGVAYDLASKANMTTLSDKKIRIAPTMSYTLYAHQGLFAYCDKLLYADMRKTKTTASASCFFQIFKACASIEEIDLSHLKVADGGNMLQAFGGCKSLKRLALPPVKPESIDQAFGLLLSIEEINLEAVDTSICTNFYSTFYGYGPKEIDISMWDKSNVTRIACMFKDAQSETIRLGTWDMGKVNASWEFLQDRYSGGYLKNIYGELSNIKFDIGDLYLSKNITRESLMVLINGLYDWTKDEDYDPSVEHRFTKGAHNTNKLTAADIKVATDKGWTIV